MGNFDSAKAFETSISMGLVGVAEKAQAIAKERRENTRDAKHFIMENEIFSLLLMIRDGEPGARLSDVVD
jgi:hypothetical protein